MLAAQLVAPGRYEVVEAPIPAPGEGEVLVRTLRASICGSDLHTVFEGTYRGEYPAAPGFPGHEGVGTVAESRSARFSAGDVVLTVPMPGRGASYAEFQVVGEDFLAPLPPGGDLDRLVMSQQLGTTLYSFRRYWPDGRDATGKVVAILGAGSAGQFLLQLALRAGFSVALVADKDHGRLKVASELGADRVVAMPEESFAGAVAEATGGEGADLVIEAAGPDECRTVCVEAVRYGGRIGFFGLPEHLGLVPFPLNTAFRKAATIEMAGNAQLEPGIHAFRDSVELIARGSIDVSHMLQPRFSLPGMQSAMEAARDHLGIKVTVDFEHP